MGGHNRGAGVQRARGSGQIGGGGGQGTTHPPLGTHPWTPAGVALAAGWVTWVSQGPRAPQRRERGAARAEPEPRFSSSAWGAAHAPPATKTAPKTPKLTQSRGGQSSGGQRAAGMGWCWHERFKPGTRGRLLGSLCSSLPELFDSSCINSQ